MVDALTQAHAAFDARAWADAYVRLAAIDADVGLDAGDLDRLARAAYLTGRDVQCEHAWSRAHQAFLAADEIAAAARCAFWLGLVLFNRGDEARGGGWIGRAGRLVGDIGYDCVEHGYLLAFSALGRLGGGDPAAALDLFGQAVDLAERYDDADLRALGRLGSGQALTVMDEPDRAVQVLDEAMVAVETGEVSTIVAGIVYCAMVITCHELLDLRRAQQWTQALADWCATQPDLVPYRGQCLVHRSEMAQLRGDWSEAVIEAQRACVRLADPPGQTAIGMAYYQRAELHRLRGEFDEAEHDYGLASACGRDPHPGLALLRLAQGRLDDASGAIQRVVAEVGRPGDRARALAAAVEIQLAINDVRGARRAADDLADHVGRRDQALLRAMAMQAEGVVLLAEGHARGAVAALDRSRAAWEQLRARYEVARVQVWLADACQALGDADTARMEQASARQVFTDLGATVDLARLDERADRPRPTRTAGLTAREVEVIRLVATGLTNRQIADELFISEKTVARHLNNMFTRLGLPNRAAAAGYAHEHGLVERD